MAFAGRVRDNASATKTFHVLRVERRVLTAPNRTIAIDNVSTVSVGTHVVPRPRGFYWLAAGVLAVMVLGSMRPDFSFGPLAPTAFTFLLSLVLVTFVVLALRPDDKTYYLLVSSNDGVLSRFPAADRQFLEDVRLALTDKINRSDEQLTFHVNFEKAQMESTSASDGRQPAMPPSAAPQYTNGAAKPQQQSPQPRPGPSTVPRSTGRPASSRPAANLSAQPTLNGGVTASTAVETFVDYAGVLPSIVEMHRFYARQPGTQHLEQRLSELELLMRSGTPTQTQRSRVRELSAEMGQILQAYPQAVELFDHVTGLVA